MRATAMLAVGLLLAALAGVADAAPVPEPAGDPEATLLSELVVPARAGGPAWWRVSHGGSTVWVLGAPSGLPRGVKWSDVLLDARLTGARRMIVPPTYSAGLGDLFGALALRRKLKAPQIEATLPPDLESRFIADSALLNQRPEHYDGWKPAVAGLFMVADFRKHAGVQELQPIAAARALAARKGVKVVPAATYKAMPFLKSIAGDLSDEVNRACLEDSLHEIEAGAGQVRSAAEAWARGDVPGALTAERGYEKCLASFPEFTAQVRRTMADEAAAIAEDLQSPGASVAIVPLRMLLAKDGVLAQLEARGYAVRTPGSN